MSLTDVFSIFPDAPGLSGLLGFVVIATFLFFARIPVHQTITAVSRALRNATRISAKAVAQAEKRLVERNQEVLRAMERETVERRIEREFERIDTAVRRDIAAYPALQRMVNERIALLDDDYRASEIPSAPVEWARAIEAVANISSTDDSKATVLEEIRESMERSQREALVEYRSANGRRHATLKQMIPHVRKLLKLNERVDRNFSGLLERTRLIDHYMTVYETRLKTDACSESGSGSSVSRLLIAGAALIVVFGGIILNFNLMFRPMQEVMGSTSLLIGFQSAEVAAFVITLLELTAGLLLMESLRVTRLFPAIGALDDQVRSRVIWSMLALLLGLASIEAGLVFMRENLLWEDAAVADALLYEGEEETVGPSWIAVAAPMGLGFILPFALIFAALPLESFIRSARMVVGALAAILLRAVAVTLRLSACLINTSGVLLKRFYDLVIFGPLLLERQLPVILQKVEQQISAATRARRIAAQAKSMKSPVVATALKTTPSSEIKGKKARKPGGESSAGGSNKGKPAEAQA